MYRGLFVDKNPDPGEPAKKTGSGSATLLNKIDVFFPFHIATLVWQNKNCSALLI